MISQWRQAFGQPEAYFGFVQLSTWCGDGELIAEMRTVGQMAALTLPKVGYATNADHGAGCDIHPPPKQYCAQRLAKSALALVYGQDVRWRSPSFRSQLASDDPPSVTVLFDNVWSAGLHEQYPFNYLDGAFDCTEHDGKCAWAELQLADGSCHNATVTIAAPTVTSEASLKLTATGLGPAKPIASRYGWGAVPMLAYYDKQTQLPVLPWSEKVPTSPPVSA